RQHTRSKRDWSSDVCSSDLEDIKIGDLLMGHDSKPRKVKSLARGRDKMYEIIPVKGESFICNEPHVLSLQMSGSYGVYKKDEIEIGRASCRERVYNSEVGEG